MWHRHGWEMAPDCPSPDAKVCCFCSCRLTQTFFVVNNLINSFEYSIQFCILSRLIIMLGTWQFPLYFPISWVFVLCTLMSFNIWLKLYPHYPKLFLSLLKRCSFSYICYDNHGLFLGRYTKYWSYWSVRGREQEGLTLCAFSCKDQPSQRCPLLLLLWKEGKKGVESCLCIRYLVFQADLSGFVEVI